MSIEGQPVTEIQIQNVSDYAHYITQANLSQLGQVAQVAHITETGEIIALVEQHIIDPQQENIDPQCQDGTQQVVEHVVFEQIPLAQISEQIQQPAEQQELVAKLQPAVARLQTVEETPQQQIKPPVGKGPFKCEKCEKVLQRWNQYQRHMKTHDDDKPFQCTQCPASFNMEENLRLHIATHVAADAEPICPECGKKFSRIASLKAHIMLHEKEETLMCTECGDEFSLQSQLDKHMMEHRQEQGVVKTYPCRQCTQEFTKPMYLREHMKQHYKIKSSLNHKHYKRNIDRSSFHYKCQKCGKTFQKPSQLQRHSLIHTGERPYKCHQCNRAFNQKGALGIHMAKHTGERPHVCEFCPMAFSQKGNLRAHIQRVHTLSRELENGTAYQCDECSCVFKKLGSLNAHISRSHSEPEKFFKVQNCNTQGLPTQVQITKPAASGQNGEGGEGAMEEHVVQLIYPNIKVPDRGQIITEEIIKSEQAEAQDENEGTSDILRQALENSGLTGGTETVQSASAAQTTASTTITIAPSSTRSLHSTPQITQVSTMTVHDVATGMTKKHIIRKINGVRWHQCTYCSKEFKKPSDLVRHIRIHTHEKPYKCTQCFRAFAVKSTLTAHIKTHTGVKEYRCNTCDKMFSTQGSLKVHLRMHTGAKPFDCPSCDKKFRTSAHRKSHVASHFREYHGSGDRPRRAFRRGSTKTNDIPDIPLQEPILITDTGLIQQPPRSNMFSHYLGEAGSVDRPFKCGFCHRGFKKSSHLKQHVRSHTGEKPYKCLQCNRAFVSSGVLKAHIRTHTGVKSYKCLICDSMFTTNGSLKRHMSTHSDVRPFMCPYCQKTFKTSVNCKKHMKTHRHELAIQALQGSGTTGDGDTIHLTSDKDQDVSQDQELVQDTMVELGIQSQDLQNGVTITQGDAAQQGILQQTTIQDSYDPFQQSLNQQLFGQQQTFSQSLLGSGQQNFNQLNSQMNAQLGSQQLTNTQLNTQMNNQLTGYNQPQYSIQGQQLQNSIDINAIQTGYSQAVTSLTSSLPSTSMQNILPTNEIELPEAQEPEPTSQPDQPTGTEDKDIEADYFGFDNKKVYHCDYCEKTFKKSSHLKQHIRSHTGEKPYKCDTCHRKFVSMGVLKAHLKTHTGLKEFLCGVCHASFTTNGSLTRHMNIHINDTLKPFKCEACDLSFRTSVLLKRHMRQHRRIVDPMTTRSKRHATTIVQVPEDQGQADEGRELSMSEKMLIESATEKAIEDIQEPVPPTEKPSKEVEDEDDPKDPTYGKHAHQCQNCSKSFKKPSDLVRHIRIHTGEKPFACEICSRAFTVKSTLDSHMKTHQSGLEKRFKCHVCSSMFSTKGSLKVHMRLHTGAKPFKCPHCDQRFRTSGHRKSHVIAHLKPDMPRKRKMHFTHEQEQNNQQQIMVNPSDITQGNQPQTISIDPSMIQSQNMLPISLTLDSNVSQISESALATHVLQSLDGLQLQLTGNLGNQGIQISALDPNIFAQTVQIDANILQQLQQQGNVNITINPNVLTQSIQAADPNLVQNIQVQNAVDPNVVIQPMSTITVDQQQLIQMSTNNSAQDGAPNAFVVTADGNLATDQNITVTPGDLQGVEGIVSNQSELPDANIDHELSQPIEPSQLNTTPDEIVDDDDDLDDLDEEEEEAEHLGSVEEENSGLLQENDMTEGEDNLTHGTESANISLSDAVQAMGAVAPGNVDKFADPERTFVCGVCNKAFKRASHLKEHMYIHDPKNAPKSDKPLIHQCMACDKAFQKPSQLQRHFRIHTGERPFVCNICSKAFNQKNALNIHLKKHTGERPHKCSYCTLSFSQKGNLKTHIKRAHHMDMVQSMNLPKLYVPPTGTNINIAGGDEGATQDSAVNEEGEINLEEVAADLFPQDKMFMSPEGGAA